MQLVRGVDSRGLIMSLNLLLTSGKLVLKTLSDSNKVSSMTLALLHRWTECTISASFGNAHFSTDHSAKKLNNFFSEKINLIFDQKLQKSLQKNFGQSKNQKPKAFFALINLWHNQLRKKWTKYYFSQCAKDCSQQLWVQVVVMKLFEGDNAEAY